MPQIKETFRFHPAVAHGLARVVPEEGVKIGDRMFSEGVGLPGDVLLNRI